MQIPFFVLLSIISLGGCWHPTGHFLTAQIAYLEITQTRPSLMPKIEKMLEILKPYTKERKHAFVESACFPDDIKYLDWGSFNKWHFYDDYIIEKGYSKELAASLHRSKINILSHVNDAKSALKNKKKSFVDDRLGKSFELRYLVHLIGDIHQPLHSTSLVNQDFPKGDAGGNAFAIDHTAKNLHTLWDKGLSKEMRDTRAPLDGKDWDFIAQKSQDLITRFPRSYFKERLELKEASKWIKESRKIAQDFAYKNLKKGEKIPDDYITKNFKIVEEQLALGGYRLADVLLDTFQDESVFEKHVKSDGESDTEDEVADAPASDDKDDTDAGKLSSDTGSDTEKAKKPGLLKIKDDSDKKDKKSPAKNKAPVKKDDSPVKIKVDLKPKAKAPVVNKKFKNVMDNQSPAKADKKKKLTPAQRKKLLKEDYSPSESDDDSDDYYLQKEANDKNTKKQRKGTDIEENDKPNLIVRAWRGFWGLFGYTYE